MNGFCERAGKLWLAVGRVAGREPAGNPHQKSAMSDDTKSRIMLWLFIFLLCMFSFFAGLVARADTYMAQETPTALDVKTRCTQGITNFCGIPFPSVHR